MDSGGPAVLPAQYSPLPFQWGYYAEPPGGYKHSLKTNDLLQLIWGSYMEIKAHRIYSSCSLFELKAGILFLLVQCS